MYTRQRSKTSARGARPLVLRHKHFLAFAVILGILASCWGLPNNFTSLTLEEKVEAYAHHLNNYGRYDPLARSWISWHGWAAADLMADYLKGSKSGLPKFEAIEIIELVQTRGCSLKGTAAEKALEAFIRTEPDSSLDHQVAMSALVAIQRNIIIPGGPDHLRGGPCQAHRRPLAQ